VPEITEAVTGVIGDYGLYAVFILMFVDALLPAASELVMVYAGAVAVGAFPGSTVTLFGWEIESTAWAYVAMATAGTVGYTLGSILGWAIGFYGGRPYLERHGRWLHVTPAKLDTADRWFERYGDPAVFFSRMLPVVRSFISIPAGIGEMPLGLQTKLLRALEEKKITPIGAERPIDIDVRFIATTNRDLKDAVERGAFRRDLYYRLSVLPVRVPPLRERPEDVPTLAEHFLAEASRRSGEPSTDLATSSLRSSSCTSRSHPEDRTRRKLPVTIWKRITPSE